MSSPRLFWADLHNHNDVSYGQGSLERALRLAENALDVCALTVHGHWPDPPSSDPTLADYHAKALARAGRNFPAAVRETNRRYQPGKFVPLIGYEWHSTGAGDYVVLFPGDQGELHRAATLEELRRFVSARGALMIPHHVGYARGVRGLDWTRFDAEVSPLVEVMSEHGSSWEPDGVPPMLAHSMGGLLATQAVTTQLQAGRHFGFTAGTDTHFGYPGSYGEGLTGIYAGTLTRESVFAALRARRTLALTGDRIELWVDGGGALPGDVRPRTDDRRIAIRVDPLGPLDTVEVIKNGRRTHLWDASPREREAADAAGPHLVRLEWGWGRMDATELADWTVSVAVRDGELRRVIPCLGGGGASVEKLNLVSRVDDRTATIESYTGRRNPVPTNGVVLEIWGDRATKLCCVAEAQVEGVRGGCKLSADLGQLAAQDLSDAVLPRFSSPRVRLGRARRKADLHFATEYHDPQPGPRDTYVVRARQVNGHQAWASPLLFT